MRMIWASCSNRPSLVVHSPIWCVHGSPPFFFQCIKSFIACIIPAFLPTSLRTNAHILYYLLSGIVLSFFHNSFHNIFSFTSCSSLTFPLFASHFLFLPLPSIEVPPCLYSSSSYHHSYQFLPFNAITVEDAGILLGRCALLTHGVPLPRELLLTACGAS